MIADINSEDPLELAISRILATKRPFERAQEVQRLLDRTLCTSVEEALRPDTLLNRVPSLNVVQPLHPPRRKRRIELPPRAPERGRATTEGDPEVEASQATCLQRLRDRWYGD